MCRSGSVLAAIFVFTLSASLSHAVTPIVVESRCSSAPAYVEGGTGWGNSSAKSSRSSCGVGSRSSRDASAYAEFVPAIVTDGTYDVFVTWGQTTNSNNGPNAEHVEISITDRDGTRITYIDMRGLPSCAGVNSDQMVYVGRGYFQANSQHKVRISNTATGQCALGAGKRYVNTDAMTFSYAATTPTLSTTWGKLKSIYR